MFINPWFVFAKMAIQNPTENILGGELKGLDFKRVLKRVYIYPHKEVVLEIQ